MNDLSRRDFLKTLGYYKVELPDSMSLGAVLTLFLGVNPKILPMERNPPSRNIRIFIRDFKGESHSVLITPTGRAPN